MADEAASETTEQATHETQSPFGADGTLAEDWHTKLTDEALHGSETLPRFKSVEALAKSYEHVRKQVPLDKIPKPTDKWGDDEWNEFYEAAGRPPTPEDYNIQRHPDIPEEAMPDELIKGYQDLFHKIGLTQKQKDALVAYNDEQTLSKMESMAKEDAHNHDVMMDSLYKEFGQATEQRTRWSNSAIERGVKGNEELRAFIQKKMNTENDVVPWSIFLSNIESNFAEHGEFADPHIDTPKDIESQIQTIIADPRYSSTDLKVRQPLIDKVNRLYEKLNKGAVVGQMAQQ